MNRTYLISSDIEEIPLADVVPGRWQPRQGFNFERLAELARSIQDHGQIDPALVWENPDGQLELVAGERRWRALCVLHLAQTYPNHSLDDWAAKVANTDARDFSFGAITEWGQDITILARRVAADDPTDLHELALVDNLERDNLTTLEEAYALRELQRARDMSIRDLAAAVGRSRSWISDRLDIYRLHPDALAALSARADTFPLALSRNVGKVGEDYQPDFAAYLVEVGATDRQAGAIAALIKKLVFLPGVTPASIKYRRSYGKQELLPPEECQNNLAGRWDRDTRKLDTQTSDWNRPRFPLDWNPRIIEDLLKPVDENILPDPAACEFCPHTHGSGSQRRCTLPACFDRKQKLWDQHKTELEKDRWQQARQEAGTDAILVSETLQAATRDSAPAPTSAPDSAPLPPAETKSEPAEPARDRPLPVMTPLAPASKPVVINVIIEPGDGVGLNERPVLLTIGEQGTIGQMHKGDYGDLITLIEIACEQFFRDNGHGELAAAELEPIQA